MSGAADVLKMFFVLPDFKNHMQKCDFFFIVAK